MAKQTLKHKVGENVATRQTARNYTHVVLARRNPDMVRAKAENDYNQQALDKTIADAEYKWKYNSNLRKVPVGEMFYFSRSQGGYYLNKTGKHMEVQQYMHDIADEYTLCHGSLENYVDHNITEFFNHKKEALAAADNCNDSWRVVSWHGSRALAEKAASSQWKTSCCDTRIEEINNGQ